MSQRTAYTSARICASAGVSIASADSAMIAFAAWSASAGDGVTSSGRMSCVRVYVHARQQSQQGAMYVKKLWMCARTDPPRLSLRRVSHTVIASL